MQASTILDALRQVQDPDLKKDLVSLGMIQDLNFATPGRISVRVVLTTPACPMKAKIKHDVETALKALPGINEVNVTMDAHVRPSASTQSGAIPGVSHIIAVSSGKGGVGKSTVAVNLATALSLEGARVGLLDVDVYGPNVPTMMGVTDSPKLLVEPGQSERFIPPMAFGVKVMSMGLLMQDDQPAMWRGPMIHSAVHQFFRQVVWGDLDYLVIDMPPGTGDVQLSVTQLVPVSGAILVTTPQEVACQDVRKAFYMFEKVRVPMLGFVENMSWFKCGSCSEKHYLFGKGGGQALANKFQIELLAQIPQESGVRLGGDEGTPVVVRAPQSEAAQMFRALAQKVAQSLAIRSA